MGNPRGPITIATLWALKSKGQIVVLVSESINCQSLDIEKVIVPGNRLQALLNARARYPGVPCVYVSDNPGDDINAQRAGCTYVHPNDFAALMERLFGQSLV